MGVIKDTWDIGGQVLSGVSKMRERSHVEKILDVMTERKNWSRTDLAKLANISDDDALRALRSLQEADRVMPIDIEEETKGTFWRRSKDRSMSRSRLGRIKSDKRNTNVSLMSPKRA